MADANPRDFQAPYGCRWCGEEKNRHGRRWKPIIGMHSWAEPDQAMILDRMLRRLDARLNAAPTKYHATTRYSGTPGDPEDEGTALCADCGTDACPQYQRIQTRRAISLTDPAGQYSGSRWGGSVPF